jgi:hypothetical protein
MTRASALQRIQQHPSSTLSRQLRNRSSPLSGDPTLDATGQGRAGAGADFVDHAPPLSVGEEPGSPPGKAAGTPPVIPGAGRRPLFGGQEAQA